MAIQIEKKITGFEVVKPESDSDKETNVTHIAPLLERDDVLEGSTYKI